MEIAPHSVHATSVTISKLLYIYLNHKTGDSVKFDLLKASTEGSVESLRVSTDGPSKEGALALQCPSPRQTKLKYDLTLNPSCKDRYSVLMLHSKCDKTITVPNVDVSFRLTGPAILIIGRNVHMFDGSAVHSPSGFNPNADDQVSIFWVGTAFSLHCRGTRTTLPIDARAVDANDLLLMLGLFNQPLPSAGTVSVIEATPPALMAKAKL